MIVSKMSKKNRSNKALFNPYKNGISTYDMAYLSSKYILQLSSIFAITKLLDLLVKDEIKIEISSSNLSLSFTFAEVKTLM